MGSRCRMPGASILRILLLHLCVLPDSVLPQVSLGKFVYSGHGLTGEVVLLNDRQYRIRGFSYDGLGPAVWHTGMRKGTVGVYSEDAYAFRNEHGNCNRLEKRYSNTDVTITIPRNLSISRDIETIAVYCYRFCHNFGHVKVPRGLKLAPPPPPGNTNKNGLCRPNYPVCSKDRTRDNGVCVDNRGSERTCPLVQQQGTRNTNNGGGTQNHNTRLNSRPNRFNVQAQRRTPRRIGRFRSYANGVVGQVTILNDRQFRVSGFSYNGARGKSTYFLLMEKGTAGVFSVKAWAVPDESGGCDGLRSYRNEDVVVTVPSSVSLNRDVGAIALYDYENCSNFGHVRLPTDMNVPVVGARNSNVPTRSVCLPYFRPCSRRDTRNDGVCKGRRGRDVTC